MAVYPKGSPLEPQVRWIVKLRRARRKIQRKSQRKIRVKKIVKLRSQSKRKAC